MTETVDPPILLTKAAYLGTLAAVRCLGAAGIPVTLADGNGLSPAAWSRYVSRRVNCPGPEEEPARFIEWLIEFGDRQPGHVLYPTSDDVAWLYARHREELSRHFALSVPGVDVVYRLLNKIRLRDAAARVGLRMPRTWIPNELCDFAAIGAEARFPVVVKPQTQVLFHPHAKGIPVHSAKELRGSYERFAAATTYHPVLLAYDPGVVRPTVQEYLAGQSENVYSLTGFIAEGGELFTVRASRKVLQQPRRLGVGLCFESAELKRDLVERVIALCREVGYHGVFEAEFIEDHGEPLLIDFNPRFYGQMAFDIARGLPQPLLAYDAALGRRAQVGRRVQAACQADWTDRVYCRRFELKLLLVMWRLFRRMSQEDVNHWSAWLVAHGEDVVDGVFDAADRRPSKVEALHHLVGFARHPRAFLRQVAEA